MRKTLEGTCRAVCGAGRGTGFLLWLSAEALTQVNELRSRSVSKEDKQKVSLRQRGNKSRKGSNKDIASFGPSCSEKGI